MSLPDNLQTNDDKWAFIWGDHEDYEFIEKQFLGKGRWLTHYMVVAKDANGKLWGVSYGEANTEYQEHELGDVHEVEAREKVITVYVHKEKP